MKAIGQLWINSHDVESKTVEWKRKVHDTQKSAAVCNLLLCFSVCTEYSHTCTSMCTRTFMLAYMSHGHIYAGMDLDLCVYDIYMCVCILCVQQDCRRVLPHLERQDCRCMLPYLGSWDSDSSAYVYVASALSTEPSLQPTLSLL